MDSNVLRKRALRKVGEFCSRIPIVPQLEDGFNPISVTVRLHPSDAEFLSKEFPNLRINQEDLLRNPTGDPNGRIYAYTIDCN